MNEEFQIYLKYPINESVQEGDVVHFSSVPYNSSGGFHVALNNPTKLGPIKKIEYFDTDSDNIFDTVRLTVEIETGQLTPNEPIGSNQGDFIMFSKSRQANISSVKGYFSEIDIENNSRDKAELFTIGCEVIGSS
mgnify:CR=1 FL=1